MRKLNENNIKVKCINQKRPYGNTESTENIEWRGQLLNTSRQSIEMPLEKVNSWQWVIQLHARNWMVGLSRWKRNVKYKHAKADM